jgi:ubiquinone/menaquinone biosynthesis C-methylase UbiE
MMMYDLLKDIIPKNHSRQVTSTYFTDNIFRSTNIDNVMDLGCGTANSINYFKMKNPNIKWVGVDIQSSPEVNLRNRIDGEFVTFDGINLPFGNDSFDMIFSNQVFEHVRNPKELLKEVRRVLKQKGYFTGSVSHLEPYHSHSLWNYTPYGFKVLIEESRLELKEIRPGIDALTLIVRRALGSPHFFDLYWRKQSPFNMLIEFISFIKRQKHDQINLVKLLFCGQFVFIAKK